MTNDKATQYSLKILEKLSEWIDEDETFMEELMEGNNATHFIHAVANLAPTQIYNQITSSNVNILEFNHIANRLCFQNSHRIKED